MYNCMATFLGAFTCTCLMIRLMTWLTFLDMLHKRTFGGTHVFVKEDVYQWRHQDLDFQNGIENPDVLLSGTSWQI